MMRKLLNAVRLQAQMAANDRAVTRIGLVDSYDPNTYAVKVRLQPENAITGWLPLLSPWIGNSWGIFAPPTIGDMIEVHFQEDDPNVGFAGQRFYNDSDRPLAVVSGEFWLVHQSGAYFKLTNDGKVTARDKAGSTVVMNGDGTGTMSFAGGLTIDANVQVNGYVHASGDVVGAGVSLDSHVHSGVQSGASNTGAPV